MHLDILINKITVGLCLISINILKANYIVQIFELNKCNFFTYLSTNLKET